MEKRYLIALDAGTTSVRALLFDTKTSEILAVESLCFPQYYPAEGQVEQDAEELFEAQRACLTAVIEKNNIKPAEIFALGITNQRETVVVWDKTTGKPAHNAIVWQDRRTAEFMRSLESYKEIIKEKTGLPLSAYFSASKIKWVLENVPRGGNLLAGTVDTWLIWKLTGGQSFVTDPSNASRTMLFNINTLEWDAELCALFGVPEKMLARVIESSEIAGYWEYEGVKIPIAGIAGDQQCALFGQGCFEIGKAKNTYGTGCFLLAYTGEKPVRAEGLITTVAWKIGGKAVYALEGSIFDAGTVIRWLRDDMGLIEHASDTERLAFSVTDTKGVYFVPAFSGLAAPYWDAGAKGAISGLTRGVKKAHIVRAALESMAYNTRAIVEEVNLVCGRSVTAPTNDAFMIAELFCDGGVSRDNFLLQFQADILGVPTKRQKSVESTALGAIFLAGLGVGAFSDLTEVAEKIHTAKTFLPQMTRDEAECKYHGWKTAVGNVLNVTR